MEKMGENFLNKKYPGLAESEEVESAVDRTEIRGEEAPANTSERIEVYLKRLEDVFREPEEGERQTLKGRPIEEVRADILKDKLHELFVISPEDIPEGYFDLQKKIAREQGHGDINILEEIKDQMRQTVIEDQRHSLDSWVDYLGSSDAMYPLWLKYFVFRNIVKLSSFDKEAKKFRQRSAGTTAPFPDINREALAYVLDALQKEYGKEIITDKHTVNPELQKLLERANFGDLYAYAIEKITPASAEQKESIAGAWMCYNKGSDATPLYESLQGHGTGWCTAGESTARVQLTAGDFYIYYSADEHGENTIPRIAIRMQKDQIAEVRGINKDQELEPALIDIAKEKMAVLPGADRYDKKSADMKRLTVIEGKMNNKENLTKDEIIFLYEINSPIEGFGYQKDPRIQELREKRDQKKDYAVLYDCSPQEVALTERELSDLTVVYIGFITRETASLWEHIPQKLQHIGGDANFRDSKVENLGQLQHIGGEAHFGDSKIKNLGQLQRIGGNAYFEDSKIKNLGQLQHIGRNAYFNGSKVENLGQLQHIGGEAHFEGSKVKNLGQLQHIGHSANFEGSKVKNLGQLQRIGDDANFEDSKVKNLGQLQDIGRNANFEDSKVENLGQLQHIGGSIYISKDSRKNYSRPAHSIRPATPGCT